MNQTDLGTQTLGVQTRGLQTRGLRSYQGAALTLLCGLSAGVVFSGCNSGTREKVSTGNPTTPTTNTTPSTPAAGATFTVSIAAVGSGAGTVSLSPQAAGNVYAQGTVVTLVAIPNSGSTFLDWGAGGASSQTYSLQLALQTDVSVSPNFAAVDSGAPIGGYTVSPDPAHVLAPANIAFTDSSSGAPTSWLWDFGDGSPLDPAQSPTHRFETPGQYTVVLRVANGNGNGSPAVKAQVVYVAARSEGSRFYYQTDKYGNPLKQNTATQAGLAEQVLTLVNQERAKVGAPPLAFDQQATDAAKVHSEDMRAQNYFSHTSPDGFAPADRLIAVKASGYTNTGENIALGQTSAAQVMNDWMNSAGHRANILNPEFTHLGVGIAEPGPYWTQVFLKR